MTNKGILALLLLTGAPTLASPGALALFARVRVVADAADASAIPSDHALLEALAKKDKDAAARLLQAIFPGLIPRANA